MSQKVATFTSSRPETLASKQGDETDLFPSAKKSNGQNPVNGSHNGEGKSKMADGLKAPSPVGKNFVLDTNVLLHDPDCIDHFAENHVCIPIEVLCELDRFKTEQTERGANARRVHRRLAEVFSSSPEGANMGIPTRDGGTLRLVNRPGGKKLVKATEVLLSMLPDLEKVDHRLLLCSWLVRQENAAPTVLVSKDLNLQLKAHAIGLPCEDYENDKIKHDPKSAGPLVVDVEADDLQHFAGTGALELTPNATPSLAPNDYVLLRAGEKNTIPARWTEAKQFVPLNIPQSIRIQRGTSIRPLNLGQQCFLDALLNPDISMLTCYGQAGTGKTLLAVAAALHATFNGGYAGVTVSRPVVALGETLGFLPGTLEEKLHPWLYPIYDALELLLTPQQKKNARKTAPKQQNSPGGDTAAKKVYQPMVDSGLIEIEALCYIRGRSIPNRFFILDEAQQLTPLEAKTIVTRMARGSKLVFIGDPDQIDNPYVDRRSNGLVYARDRLKDHRCSAHVELARGERSELAEAGARFM